MTSQFDDEAVLLEDQNPLLLNQKLIRAHALFTVAAKDCGFRLNHRPGKTEAIVVHRGRNTHEAKDQMQVKEVLSMLLLFWSALSPHGFLLAASIFIVYPPYWREDHGERFAGFFSDELSPLWAMCLMSAGKTVAFAAATVSARKETELESHLVHHEWPFRIDGFSDRLRGFLFGQYD